MLPLCSLSDSVVGRWIYDVKACQAAFEETQKNGSTQAQFYVTRNNTDSDSPSKNR